MSKKIFIDTSKKNETRTAVTLNGKLDDFEIELTKKNAGEINIPITIVPGNLSYKKIQDIS